MKAEAAAQLVFLLRKLNSSCAATTNATTDLQQKRTHANCLPTACQLKVSQQGRHILTGQLRTLRS
jgi:hypothetical protein